MGRHCDEVVVEGDLSFFQPRPGTSLAEMRAAFIWGFVSSTMAGSFVAVALGVDDALRAADGVGAADSWLGATDVDREGATGALVELVQPTTVKAVTSAHVVAMALLRSLINAPCGHASGGMSTLRANASPKRRKAPGSPRPSRMTGPNAGIEVMG